MKQKTFAQVESAHFLTNEMFFSSKFYVTIHQALNVEGAVLQEAPESTDNVRGRQAV